MAFKAGMIGVTLLIVASSSLVSVTNAGTPPGGAGSVGPDSSCGGAVGWGGSAAGSPSGYHTYEYKSSAGPTVDGCSRSSPSCVDTSFNRVTCGDGEFEFGYREAWLNVRTTATANGGDGLSGCYGPSGPESAGPYPDCGSATYWGCVSDALATATAHHASDAKVFVQDAATNDGQSFDLVSDWARDATQSADLVDHNKAPASTHHCGDSIVEPCDFTLNFATDTYTYTLNAGTANNGVSVDTQRGNAAAATSEASFAAAFASSTNAFDIGARNQAQNGCNAHDYRLHQSPGSAGPAANFPGGVPNTLTTGTLAAFGQTGYTGGAAGYLLVVLDAGPDPTYYLSTPTTSPSQGWIWTG